MKAILLYNEQIELYEVHKYNLIFKIFGRTMGTNISYGGTEYNAIEKAKKQIRGNIRIIRQIEI